MKESLFYWTFKIRSLAHGKPQQYTLKQKKKTIDYDDKFGKNQILKQKKFK